MTKSRLQAAQARIEEFRQRDEKHEELVQLHHSGAASSSSTAVLESECEKLRMAMQVQEEATRIEEENQQQLLKALEAQRSAEAAAIERSKDTSKQWRASLREAKNAELHQEQPAAELSRLRSYHEQETQALQKTPTYGAAGNPTTR